MNMMYYILGAIAVLWIIGSVSRHLRGRGKAISVTEANCIGCGKCLKRCHHNVFEMVKGEKSTHVVAKNLSKCTACGDCLGACKFNALEIVKREKNSFS
jgi:NAD-dependent dihydropyrimidine dehydrogenase PreA subunit